MANFKAVQKAIQENKSIKQAQEEIRILESQELKEQQDNKEVQDFLRSEGIEVLK